MPLDDAALERFRDQLLAAIRDSESRIRGEFTVAISASEQRIRGEITEAVAARLGAEVSGLVDPAMLVEVEADAVVAG